MSLVCLSSANFCGLSCESSLDEAFFWDDSQADQFDAVCGVWSKQWQADPPTPSTSVAMLAALICLFPKHNLWTWCWACALNFFGRPWRGLFWVEPVLLNRCMGLWAVSWPSCCSSVSGSWQSSYSLHNLYVAQQFFFSDSQRVICHEVPCWNSSDQYERVRAITTAPPFTPETL